MTKARKVHVKPRYVPPPFVTKTINAVSWKPMTAWIITLRRHDGFKDTRNFSGSYADAAFRRDEYLRDSLYASAWLIEVREKLKFKKVTRIQEGAAT